eukprot:2570123-Prymnesium_polylepis.1
MVDALNLTPRSMYPAIALTAGYFVLSLAIGFFNKWALGTRWRGGAGFTFPFFYSTMHMVSPRLAPPRRSRATSAVLPPQLPANTPPFWLLTAWPPALGARSCAPLWWCRSSTWSGHRCARCRGRNSRRTGPRSPCSPC